MPLNIILLTSQYLSICLFSINATLIADVDVPFSKIEGGRAIPNTSVTFSEQSIHNNRSILYLATESDRCYSCQVVRSSGQMNITRNEYVTQLFWYVIMDAFPMKIIDIMTNDLSGRIFRCLRLFLTR
ncbi:hypothetical protein ACJX0J_032666, partial [Zea mays]